jgi:stage III sporulation protein AF
MCERKGAPMLDALYEWIRNIAFYLVIVTVVLEAVPGDSYKKYIRFFTGLVLILLLITPLLKLTGTADTFYALYHNKEYEQEKRMIEQQERYWEEIDLFDFLPEEYQGSEEEQETDDSGIEVEEIRIGE